MSLCPYCHQPLQQGQSCIRCPGCGNFTHQACWEKHQGCAVPGCTCQPKGSPAIKKAKVQDAGKKPLQKYLPILIPVLIILIVSGILLITALNRPPVVTPQLLEAVLDKAMYQEAMDIASQEEKPQVLRENLAAFLCRDVPGYLSNPSTFTLERAWVDIDGRQGLLYGKGDDVTQYWLFTYDPETRLYPLTGNIQNPNATPNHEAWNAIQSIMAHSDWQLDAARIPILNQLRKDGVLYTMTLLDTWRP